MKVSLTQSWDETSTVSTRDVNASCSSAIAGLGTLVGDACPLPKVSSSVPPFANRYHFVRGIFFEHASSFNFLELEKKIIPRELTVGISFFGVGSVYKGVAIVRDE